MHDCHVLAELAPGFDDGPARALQLAQASGKRQLEDRLHQRLQEYRDRAKGTQQQSPASYLGLVSRLEWQRPMLDSSTC